MRWTIVAVVAILTNKLEFPRPETATPEGLVAVGGDLSVERLLLAYRSGIFPWPVSAHEVMTWFSPDPRAILELDQLHLSRSLAKKIRRGAFEVRINSAFVNVVKNCSSPTPNRPTTWITDEIELAYTRLHRAGFAHSVESWSDGKLVGGLYGVGIGGFFAGESMFSHRSDASKVALVFLVRRLRERGFALLDIQQGTQHLLSMGAKEIPRATFLRRLAFATSLNCKFT